MRWLPLIALIAACEPPIDVEPLACLNEKAGTATLGEGDLTTGFSALKIDVDSEDCPIDSEEPCVQISFGPQGMHMIVVAVQVEHLEMPSGARVGSPFEISMTQNNELVGGTIGEIEPLTEEGISDFLGIRTIITHAEVGQLVGEYPTEVQAVVTDGCGRQIEDTRTVWLYQ